MLSTIQSNMRKLRHVVLFKFRETSAQKTIDALHQEFIHLGKSLTFIQDFEWGYNDSPEDLHQGLTHCYILTFFSEADRDTKYTPNPLHQTFVSNLQPHLEKVLVVDYWAN